jgi:hypothetical protein
MRKTPINFLYLAEKEIRHRIKNAIKIKRQKNNDRHGQYPNICHLPYPPFFHYGLPLKFNYPDILGEGLDVFGPEEFSLFWRGLGGGQT